MNNAMKKKGGSNMNKMTKKEKEAIERAREMRYKKMCPLFNGICRKNNCVFWNVNLEGCDMWGHYRFARLASWDITGLLVETNKLLTKQLKILKNIQPTKKDKN